MYITCCSLVAGEQCWPPHAVGTVPDLCQHGVHPPYRGHPQCGQPTDGLSMTKVTGLQCVQYSVHITVYSVYIAVCRVGTYITVYCTRVNHTVHCTSAKTVWEAEYNGRRRGGVFWLDFILVVSVKNNRLVVCGELTSLLCEDFSRKVKPDYSYYCKRRADLKKRF